MNNNSIKTIIITTILLFSLGFSSCASGKEDNTDRNNEYNAEAAVEYALKYAKDRNILYPEFENNCANFVSQCLIAGGISQDKGTPPTKNHKIIYDNTESLWYYYGKQYNVNKPPNFSVSYSFISTDYFLKYWSTERNMEIVKFDNSFVGREEMYNKTDLGDIFIYYDTDGNVSHLGIVTGKDDFNLYYCGNTVDRLNMSFHDIDNAVYPQFGIISFD